GADYLILESTYGNRLHSDKNGKSGKEQLRDVINATARRGGTVLIPSFAIGRAQELLYILRELELENQIPVLPVYVDSPMAVDAVDIFRQHVEEHDLEMAQLERSGGSPLYTQRVHFARTWRIRRRSTIKIFHRLLFQRTAWRQVDAFFTIWFGGC